MGTFWRVVIGLVLCVPLVAYVVGPLTPSDADRGERSRPVIVGEVQAPDPSSSPTTSPTASPTTSPSDGADEGTGTVDTDGGARVHNPEPQRFESRDAADDDAEEESGQRGDETDDDGDDADDADDD